MLAVRLLRVGFVCTMSTGTQGEDKKRVQEDRGLAVDAAVVRIMKSRKVLSHNDLVRVCGMHTVRCAQLQLPAS